MRAILLLVSSPYARTNALSDSNLTLTGMKLTLDQLLSDVLLSVWVHLDDPVPLSRANKRFHALSKDVLWRAKWFMQRYDIYLVLFEAMTRSKLFTPDLFERLIRLGAPLSSRLVQLVHVLGDAASRQAVCGHEYTRWGTISPQSYAAVMTYAVSIMSGAA